jgi:N-acetyl sugar amidotransferase
MNNYKQCTRCILDTNDDPYITFDKDGVCNHCLKYDKQAKEHIFQPEVAKKKLDAMVAKIKAQGVGKEYDTILGVSGGVDSTYLAYLAKQQGLRVLLFHFDNGWNSELAVQNIENLSKKLDYDLTTYVVDWNEFREVQLSYIRASVVDIEAITDHSAIFATKQLARKLKIHNVLIGTNIVTESILPPYWIFSKMDWKNLRDIYRIHGEGKLKTLPVSSRGKDFFYKYFYKINLFSWLNYVSYIKKDVKELIIKEFEWRDYGGKHYESIWTRFYQGYILPQKFNIDKRKAHVSNLICSGQLTRQEALEEMKTPIYDPVQLKIDKEFVLKKLNLTADEFDKYMNEKRREHTEFKHIKPLDKKYPFLKPVKKIFRFLFPIK